jgi:hypothetical protein
MTTTELVPPSPRLKKETDRVSEMLISSYFDFRAMGKARKK